MFNSNFDEERIVIYEDQNSADVFGTRLDQKDPTSLYVEVIRHILMRYPMLIGQKETHFTTDRVRRDNYTGKTREVKIGENIVYVKTGFSTKDKWKGINAVCKLAGIEYRLEQTGVAAEKSITPKTIATIPVPEKNNMSIEQFKGCFDQQAHYSCSNAIFYGRETIGPAYDTNANRTNYILYKNSIYFLCDKSFLENGTVDGVKNSGRAVFGSINLATYKVEILKEYPSIGFEKKLGSRSPMVISVSHDKIWYITYLHDDAQRHKADPGNLAVKCLDINTRIESVVMELPEKVQEARLPIVMGNVLTYIEGGNLVCHNLVTNSIVKKQCADILGYNSSYIFFKKSKECEITDVYMLDVLNGEATLMRTYIKNVLGIEDPVKRIYYIDCKNNVFYGEINAKTKAPSEGNFRIIGDKKFPSKPYYPVMISWEHKSIEVIETCGNGGYVFLSSIDGRFEAEAFDGCQYRITRKSKYGNNVPNDLQEFLVRIEKNGKRVFVPYKVWDNSSVGSSVLVALGDVAIAQIAPETVALYHKGNWYKIFGKG